MFIHCMKKTRPTIQQEITNNKNRIMQMTIKEVVKEFGNGGHVLIPKELIGKYVVISYPIEEVKNDTEK